MKKTALLLICLFCLFLNTSGQYKAIAKEEIHPEEYNVYKTILEPFLKSSFKQLVIRKFTSGNADESSLISGDRKTSLLKAFEPETIDEYNSRLSKPTELKNNFAIDMPVNLVTDKELKPIFDRKKETNLTENAVEVMEKQYQTKVIITFSRVSFNKSNTLALVHVEFVSDLSYSRGYIYILSKIDNRWSVRESLHTRF
jgi:hypothetical protein